MSESEFAGFALAIGVVRGARSFEVDKLGRLTGIHYPQVWVPGENVAECRKRAEVEWVADAYARLLGGARFNFSMPSLDPMNFQPAKPAKPVEVTKPEPEPHSMGNCKCGFYGYYDGSDDYGTSANVSGVVEGYGETLIGTRGFRASKARIVALNISREVPEVLAAKIRRNYSSVSFFDRFRDMVAEFPPDDEGQGCSPSSDAEFWTRAI